MSNADEMRRLKEEIIASFDARVESVAEIVKSTKKMMGQFRDEHAEMSDELKAKLAQANSELTKSEKERLKQTQTEIKDRMQYINNLLSEFRGDHIETTKAMRELLDNNETTRLDEFKAMMDSIHTQLSERKEDVFQMLSDFNKSHAEMSTDLFKWLSSMKRDLTKTEKERFNQSQAEAKERANSVHVLIKSVSKMMTTFRKDHKEMAKTLKAMLSDQEGTRLDEFKALMSEILNRQKDREKEGAQMLAGFHKSHNEMSKELINMLSQINPDLTKADKKRLNLAKVELKERLAYVTSVVAEVANMLADFHQENKGMAAEWQKLCEIMEKKRSNGIPKAKVKKQDESQAKVTVIPANSDAEKILSVINGNSKKGIKLTEIGKALDKKWQTFIPQTKELMNEGKIRKVDNLYFPAK